MRSAHVFGSIPFAGNHFPWYQWRLLRASLFCEHIFLYTEYVYIVWCPQYIVRLQLCMVTFKMNLWCLTTLFRSRGIILGNSITYVVEPGDNNYWGGFEICLNSLLISCYENDICKNYTFYNYQRDYITWFILVHLYYRTLSWPQIAPYSLLTIGEPLFMKNWPWSPYSDEVVILDGIRPECYQACE